SGGARRWRRRDTEDHSGGARRRRRRDTEDHSGGARRRRRRDTEDHSGGARRRRRRDTEDHSGGARRRRRRDTEDHSGGARRRRRRDTEDHSGGARRRRQTTLVTEETIRARVTEAILLEWDVAAFVQDELAKDTHYLVRHLSVRTVQNLIPQLPWVILTDLSLIDTLQISGLSYLQSVDVLLLAADPDVVKMLVYVQCVASLLPYLPSTVRSRVEAARTGIDTIYSEESCSRLTLTVAFDETMSGLELWEPLGFLSDTRLAKEIAAEATSRLKETYSRYNAADQPTKQNILTDLTSLRFSSKNFTNASGGRHSILSLTSLPETSTSLVTIVSSVLKHKRSAAATAALAADVKPEGSLLWSLGFSPLVRAAEGTVVLPPGLILLSRWAREAEFIQEFFMSLVHRALIDFVLNKSMTIRKYLFSSEYLETHACSLRSFRNVYRDEPETSESVREMQLSVLTEAAVQGLIFRDVDRSTNAAVKLGSDYFYERDLIYLAYAQKWCSPLDSTDAAAWQGFSRTDFLLDQTMKRDYRSSNWFYRCQRPSCFFWAQGDSLAVEGTR
ncbi:hypothetical protein RRG08_022331, partial [Elysia crispata]